jgi:hypothetical protein
MARIRTVKQLVRILQEDGAILPGSLSRLTQRKQRKGSRRRSRESYWYLTWKEGGRSRALYIPPGDVARVARAVENLREVRGFVSKIAVENLAKLTEDRDVRKKR